MARRLSLTSRGVFALIVLPLSLLAGLLTGTEELVLVAIALATVLGVGLLQSAARARTAATHWHVSVQLISSDASVGSELPLLVVLAANGRAADVPTWLENPTPRWERHQAGALERRSPRPNPSLVIRVPVLDEDGTVAFSFPAPTERRGVFTFRPLRLWCFDSFGLFAQVVAVGPSATIAVHPVPTHTDVDESLLHGEPGTEELPVLTAPLRRDDLGDFAGIRPYVPGDRLRLLYWPALARTGELMVRHFEETGPRRVQVMADVRTQLGEKGIEQVLAAVAGVGLRALALGTLVEFSTSTGQRLTVAPGAQGPTTLLRAIAAIQVAEGAPTERRGHRHDNGSAAVEVPLHLGQASGAPLIITTEAGAGSIASAGGPRHVVVAP